MNLLDELIPKRSVQLPLDGGESLVVHYKGFDRGMVTLELVYGPLRRVVAVRADPLRRAASWSVLLKLADDVLNLDDDQWEEHA